jgi:transcriptional activator protein UGA3
METLKVTKAKQPEKKRSRSGCISCRKRKKKCDEIKPICTGCLNRNVVCEYKQIASDMYGNGSEIRIETRLNAGSVIGSEIVVSPENKQTFPEKINTITNLRTLVGETVMRILENNFSNLNSLFDHTSLQSKDNETTNLGDNATENFPSLDDLLPIDSDFLNIIFEDQPQYLELFANPTPSIPQSLDLKLPVPLTFEELGYFEFYCKSILPNLSILPQEFNYYTKIYIPIAFKEKSVLYTLVAWGCRMRKNINLNFQIENREADNYIVQVNEFIDHNEKTLDREKFITNFVCYMLLVCMEVSFGDTTRWSHYFTCCFNMINKMPGNFRYLLSACSIEGNLLAENFAYFDVLASQSNENGTFYPMADYHDLFSQNNTTKIVHDPLQGCIRPLILLIGEVVSMLVEYSSLQISLDLPECDRFDVISKMMKKSEALDKSIRFAKPDLSCLQYLDSSDELESHLTLFEVYQLSSQIYLRQVIRKLPPVVPEIQVLAYNLKEDLKILITTPKLKNSLAFPMLLLGISAVSPGDRKEIIGMFKSLIQSCGYLSSYQKLMFVVQKIWDLNNNGSLYVDWFRVTKQLGWRLNLGR